MTTGERIKAVRLKNGFSQVGFADKINVTKQTLYKYENNIVSNIPADKIELAAEVLEVSPAYLMGWDTEEDKNFYNARLGENIRICREQAGLSQEQLANMCNCSPEIIQRYEYGARVPREKELQDISSALGISISRLFDNVLHTISQNPDGLQSFRSIPMFC